MRSPPPLPRRPCRAALATLALLAACATNPATGQKELSLVSESQEIALGKANDQQVVQSLGLVDDAELQAYVEGVGQRLAALSERPNLPWTFRVADDPTVNAFALPGGFIYVTRGLMEHINSEAELAGVLGHEIGHVTARHSVGQISRAQLANLGLGIGMILEPDLARYSDLASTGLGLLFLKYGRDDERQADDLGLRYLGRAGYDPRPMADVFTTLERVSQLEGAGRIPTWLATHPSPEERRTRYSEALAATPGAYETARVERDAYIRHLDGLVYGPNPREGFFRQNVFHHPDLAFRIDFPEGWRGVNQKSAVAAVSPRQDAIIQLTLSGETSPEAAARTFASQGSVRTTRFARRDINGLSAAVAEFQAVADQQTPIQGIVAFVPHGGRVYQLLGYSAAQSWPSYDRAVAAAIGSFARETDSRVLNVQPDRIQVVVLDEPLTPEALAARYSSNVPVERLALINGVEPNEPLPAGVPVKVVRTGS